MMSRNHRWKILLTGALVAAVPFTGCRPPASNDAAPQAAPVWDWRSFPEASELLIAQLPATVQPARLEFVRAPATGRLQIDGAAVRGGALKAGQIWATLEPVEAAEEAAALAKLQQQLDERRARYVHFEKPLALIRLDRELADAQEALALAQFAEKSPEFFKGDAPALDPRLKPTVTAAQAEEQLRLLQERRVRTAAGEADTEPPDVQGLATEIEQRRRMRDARRERLTLKAEFAGRLRFAADFSGGSRLVAAGDLIATLEDNTTLEVRVPAALPLLHAVRPESLQVVVSLPSGGTAAATFSSVGLELKGETAVPVMRFHLALAASEAQASPPFGVELLSLIYTALPAPARIVPKLALVQRDATNALSDGWRAGLAKIFPGYELVAEGRQAVAISPPR